MTQEREALKLALEYMNEYYPSYAKQAAHHHRVNTAIKEALAQPEPPPECPMDSYGDGNVYRGQRSRDSVVKTITLAQQEQIPPSAYSNTHQPEQEPCDMKDMCIGCSPRNADGSCPDAQHKPLTDKQLNIIGSRWHLNLLGADEKAELFAFARAIEAAHGIKE